MDVSEYKVTICMFLWIVYYSALLGQEKLYQSLYREKLKGERKKEEEKNLFVNIITWR